MNDSLIPDIEQLIPKDLVGCVCTDLKLGRNWAQVDWSKPGGVPTPSEAAKIRDYLLAHLAGLSDADRKAIAWLTDEEFAHALDVELEHGPERGCSVTNNHPLLTGMIVCAHLKETPLYYALLQPAEIEAERLASLVVAPPDAARLRQLEEELKNATIALGQAELRYLATY
jgi:Protein of unknown function (DUF5661)